MMKWFITGVSGNLARQIVERLVHDGQRVIGLDLCQSPYTDDIEYLQGDITDTVGLQRLIERTKPEVVLHMASLLSASSEANPDKAWRVNADASFMLLHTCLRAGVRQFFYPSTGATYGGQLPDELPEDYPQWPRTIYGATKVAVERVGVYLADRYGLDFRSLRLPMVISKYAPRAAVSAYASLAMVAASRNEPFAFPVEPRIGISTVYVSDIVDGVFRLLNADSNRLSRRVYNIHGFAATAGEIANEICCQRPTFTHTFRPDSTVMAVLDSLPSKHIDDSARDDWGWKPSFGLEETVRDMVFGASEE